jgi:hypothetical protein
VKFYNNRWFLGVVILSYWGVGSPSWAETPPTTSPATLNQLQQYGREGQGKKRHQVTSVSQLSDVQPTDWAFQALQSLVERYGCIAGYPDGTYKGNRALTRYEFAAGVNACLERINELINASTAELVTREDLATLQRLMEEFAAELASLRGRVTALEARTGELEANQFSTTTQLQSEIIFSIADFSGKQADGKALDQNQTTLGYRARLNFLTSFSGRDRLRTRLQSGNVPFEQGGTAMTDLGWAAGDSTEFTLNKLEYRFPVGENFAVWVTAVNMNMDDIADPLNPLAVSASTGALSYYGEYAAIYKTSEGPGVAFSYDFAEGFNWVGGYVANEGANAEDGSGLFNGGNAIFTQLTYYPSDNAALAVAYAYNYFAPDNVFVSGRNGSQIAETPFGAGTPTSAHHFLLNGTVYISDHFNLSAWGQYTYAEAESGARQGDSADIWSWAAILSLIDLLKEGDALGFVVAAPPNALNVENGPEDEEISLLFELFYNFQFNEYISLTPGAYVVTNPDNDRDAVWVGVLRMGFQF